MADTVSFKWDESTEVTTGKNGYTESQQRDYMTRTATDLVKENRKVQEEELYQDRNFIDSMSILRAKQEGADAEPIDDQELVKWGLGYLADVNYNLIDLGEAAVDFNDATDMEKMAMAYGMETYDAKDVTWDGVGRFAQAFATDPTNLIGFGTLGAGFAAKFAGKGVAKQAFKKMLLNPANIAAMEGAAFVGTEDAMRQDLEVDVGIKDEYDLGQTAMATGIGAVGGKVLGEGAAFLGRVLGKKDVPKAQELQKEIKAVQTDMQANIGFAPELFAGSINGINYDEETGEISFDPQRFMEAFLAGHVAKKIATNPRLNAKAKKEAMAYAQRMHDKFEASPAYNYITGIQKAVDDRGVKASSLKKMTREQLEEIDTEALDKEAFGINIGDIIEFNTKDLKHKYDDVENAEYKFKQGGMGWVNSVDLSEPIMVSFEDGKYFIEDGHHRWFAANKLGKKIKAEVEDIKDNPINAILSKNKKGSK